MGRVTSVSSVPGGGPVFLFYLGFPGSADPYALQAPGQPRFARGVAGSSQFLQSPANFLPSSSMTAASHCPLVLLTRSVGHEVYPRVPLRTGLVLGLEAWDGGLVRFGGLCPFAGVALACPLRQVWFSDLRRGTGGSFGLEGFAPPPAWLSRAPSDRQEFIPRRGP